MDFETIRAVLDRHPDLTLAIVFGSLAQGRARRESDLDIAVKARKPLTADQKIALIEDLALATGRAIDLIDLSTAGIPLLGEIIRGGTRILGSNEAYAELALRNIYLNEDFLPYVKRSLKERNRRWLDD
jgi:predicted nucleotidyltransferase